MNLEAVLNKIEIKKIRGSKSVEVTKVTDDSRAVVSGSCYVAIKGFEIDGHKFINQALNQGATIIICEQIPENIQEGITYIEVLKSRKALAQLALEFYNHPSKKLNLIGITGTNGKTTSVTLLFNLFKSLGFSVGLISTISNKIDDKEIISTHTTPGALSLNKLLSEMLERGVEFCFMEVSSHAIEQYRTYGLEFKTAVFTNITHDHLDYHGDFKNYLYAKKKLFDTLSKESFALVNADDRNAEVMLQNTKANKKFFSIKKSADFNLKIIEQNFEGTLLKVDGVEFWSNLIGQFNAYNLLLVYSIACFFDVNQKEIVTGLSKLLPVKGRFNSIKISKTSMIGIVDYAHTPDALLNVVKTISGIKNRSQNLVTIMGCGGDRDKAKRPKMTEIAFKYSHTLILTSDNPRGENPEAIIQDMLFGLPQEDRSSVFCIADRRSAIKTAVRISNPNDIILLAGKGHESYQIVGDKKIAFDDHKELTQALKTV